MAEPQEQEAKRLPPPYVSFTTLRKQLERMARQGVPNRVDRSYLHGMSGGYQNQIFAALKGLGLTDDVGAPTADLESLVESGEMELDLELGLFLQKKINELYPEMLDLAAKNGTAAQLATLFREKYGIGGTTLSAAIRFYLEASKFAGMPVGALFKVPPRASRATGVRKAAKKAPQGAATASPPVSPDPSSVSPMASTLRVPLSSGGSVVLTTAVDLVALSPDDRTFVFELIDKVKGYSPLEPPEEEEFAPEED